MTVQVSMVVIQVCLLSAVYASLIAFDPSQTFGRTYLDLMRRQRGRPLSRGPPSVHPPMPPSTSFFSSTYKYLSPNGRPRNPGPRGRLFPEITHTNIPTPFQPQVDSTGTSPNVPLLPPVCDDPPLVCVEGKYRTADGSCNNLQGHPTWGMAGRPQERLLSPAYRDGIERPRTRGLMGHPLPSAREVSQTLHTGDHPLTESANLTHLFTMWGQFLDHDITHTPVARDSDGSKLDCCNRSRMYPERDLYWISTNGIRSVSAPNLNPNCFPIRVSPVTDRYFTSKCMNFVRSKAFAPSQACRSATREQGNTETAYVDASQIYGVSLGHQFQLRTGQMGQLKSSCRDLLPMNSTTMCTKRPNSGDFCFGSGDPRVNEHPMLSSVHIVFHRLHNHLASQLAVLNPWDDETLYQETRKIVGAIMQHVTYAEYLPLVLGDREMARYKLTLDGAVPYLYDPYVNPNIFNSFSTAAFRFGHSMVNGKNSYGYHKLNLRDMFFRPYFVQHEQGSGLLMLLNGLIKDHSQSRDRFMSKDLTDHLFQTKDGRSLDLASLNIQRGRDHGLPSYNEFRKLCGLPTLQEVMKLGTFSDVPFLSVYRDLQDVDLFTGGLSERPAGGGVVGPTFSCIIARQFHNLKHGDRFWYQNTQHVGAFTHEQIQTIDRIGLADTLCATTGMTAVQVNPFLESSMGNPAMDCASFPPIDLHVWQEIV